MTDMRAVLADVLTSPQSFPHFDHDALLIPCLKGCGRLVPRNLDADHGICSRCWSLDL